MRQHVKNKDARIRVKLETLNASKPRERMPRPAVFRDRTKYDRKAFRIPDTD